MSVNLPPSTVPSSAAVIPATDQKRSKQAASPAQPTPIRADQIQLNPPKQGQVPEPIKLIPTTTANEPKPSDWKLKFTASHSFTKYFNTDMHLSSSRVNATIKDFEIVERGSRDFFNPNNWEQPMDAFRWIDEPTNTFALTLEKGKNEFSFSAFHPKFLYNADQIKHIQGTVDGVAVDHVDYVNKPFDGYNQEPGELEITRFQNTHLQMEFELGYGRRMTLIEHPKAGKLVYTPGVSAGVMAGGGITAMVKEGEWWEHDEVTDQYGIQGIGGSIRNKLAWESPNGKFSVFGENKTSLYQLEHGFMDGKANYTLGYTSTAVGATMTIFNKKKK